VDKAGIAVCEDAVELLHLPAFSSLVISTGFSGELVNAEGFRQEVWFVKGDGFQNGIHDARGDSKVKGDASDGLWRVQGSDDPDIKP